jgi:hypothetical protein
MVGFGALLRHPPETDKTADNNANAKAAPAAGRRQVTALLLRLRLYGMLS